MEEEDSTRQMRDLGASGCGLIKSYFLIRTAAIWKGEDGCGVSCGPRLPSLSGGSHGREAVRGPPLTAIMLRIPWPNSLIDNY